jgi:hypothetical protein
MSKTVSSTASIPCKFFLQGKCKNDACKFFHPATAATEAPAASAASAKPKQPKQRETPQRETSQRETPQRETPQRETPQRETPQQPQAPPRPAASAKPKQSYVPPSERKMCNVGHCGSECKDGDCSALHQTQWEREFSNGWREVTTVLRYRVVSV